MGIQSFLKAQRGDPDWVFTPDHYFEKQFKVIDANMLELGAGKTETMVLRVNPSEKELLAKNLRIEVKEDAVLNLTIINEAMDHLQQVFLYDIRVRDGGILNLHLFVKGGKLNKHIFQVTVDSYSMFKINGATTSRNGGDCEIVTKVIHTGSYSISEQYFSSEASAKSQSVVQAMVKISETTKNVHSVIDFANLITGEGGVCQCVPEVYNPTDTARVSLSTMTELLDEERTYYLHTRGISPERTREMILSKFREPILELIEDDELKEEIDQLFL